MLINALEAVWLIVYETLEKKHEEEQIKTNVSAAPLRLMKSSLGQWYWSFYTSVKMSSAFHVQNTSLHQINARFLFVIKVLLWRDNIGSFRTISPWTTVFVGIYVIYLHLRDSFERWEPNKSKCFFTNIHLDLFRCHPSVSKQRSCGSRLYPFFMLYIA